jgi:multidrug resistance protein
VILLLAASVALMMTGFGIIMPIFARRLGEFGSGVEGLGLMSMSFALAQLLAAPVMGSLADRFGRRPLVLLALGAFAAANIGFLFARSTAVFIVIRSLEGALTAGLFPAAMGVVADVVPPKHRAQWIGVVMGSYGAGLIFGPVLGGVLYDSLGYSAPFTISAIMATIAFIAAVVVIQETRTGDVRRREELRDRHVSALDSGEKEMARLAFLPRPLHVFVTLLVLDFIAVFGFAFVQPQMVFYFYEELEWSTIQFGAVVGVYGLAMVFGQLVLGRSSDRIGRKPVIIMGILLNTTIYAGLAWVTGYPLMMLVAVVSGLGAALVSPALSSYYLDIPDERHRSRILGIKESAASFGGVVGPLLLVAISTLMTPQGIFIIAGVIMLGAAALALTALPSVAMKVAKTKDIEWEYSDRRALAAQSALIGVVLRARASRQARVRNIQ